MRRTDPLDKCREILERSVVLACFLANRSDIRPTERGRGSNNEFSLSQHLLPCEVKLTDRRGCGTIRKAGERRKSKKRLTSRGQLDRKIRRLRTNSISGANDLRDLVALVDIKPRPEF